MAAFSLVRDFSPSSAPHWLFQSCLLLISILFIISHFRLVAGLFDSGEILDISLPSASVPTRSTGPSLPHYFEPLCPTRVHEKYSGEHVKVHSGKRTHRTEHNNMYVASQRIFVLFPVDKSLCGIMVELLH